MTSRKPYLIRAIHEWILDNHMTPYLAVNTNIDGVIVPTNYIENDAITLNLSPVSVRHLELGNELICFETRFSGQALGIQIPVDAVQAIYAKENGEGMLFIQDDQSPPPDDGDNADNGGNKEQPRISGKPTLKVVK